MKQYQKHYFGCFSLCATLWCTSWSFVV